MSATLRAVVVAAAIVTALLLATDVWPGLRGPESWQWERRVALSPLLPVSLVVFAEPDAWVGRARP